MPSDPVVNPTGSWPDVPCPPGAPTLARVKLDEIITLASADQKEDVEQCAVQCRDTHGPGAQHQGAATGPSQQVHRAWQFARQAGNETRPGRKATYWLSCKNELEHTP